MKHLLSVLAAVLMISVPRASAQSTQLDVLWHSVIGTRVVDVVNQWQTTPLRGAYLLTMTDVQTGAASEVPLPHARGAVSRIEAWNDRVMVIVRERASVIDLVSGTVVDEFLCESPVFSDDHRVMTYHPVLASGEVSLDIATYEMGPAKP